MIIAIDFDGTLVNDEHEYDDLQTGLEFLPGAEEALRALKAAGHTLILNSARARLSLRENWRLNPLWDLGIVPFNEERWIRNLPINQARYEQMLRFAAERMDGLIDAVDDGRQGKVGADYFIDDRNIAFDGTSGGWAQILAILADDGGNEAH